MDETTPVSAVMSRPAVATREHAKAVEAARLMREFHISGLPVLDEHGRLVGMLSERDLVGDLHRATGVGSDRGLLDLLLDSAPPHGPTVLEACRRRMETARVGDLMTRAVVTIAPEASLRDAARAMDARQIRRLPVVDGRGGLVGVLTADDLVRSVADPSASARPLRHLHPGPAKAGATDPEPNADL